MAVQQINRTQVYDAIRGWIHETPLSLCTAGSDTCDDHELADALTDLIMESSGELRGAAFAAAVEETKKQVESIQRREAYHAHRKQRRWWQG